MYQPVPLHTDPVTSYINPYCPILTQYHHVSTSTTLEWQSKRLTLYGRRAFRTFFFPRWTVRLSCGDLRWAQFYVSLVFKEVDITCDWSSGRSSHKSYTSQQKLVMVMLMLVFLLHDSCVDTGTCIDTILMLTTTCWNRCCWCFSGDVDVDEDGDVLTLLLIVDFNFGNVFICVCIPWPLLFFTNLTPHW